MLRYTMFQYYSGNYFQVLYYCDFRTSLLSVFWCQNSPHYNLENNLFDLDITWNFMAKITENLVLQYEGTYHFKWAF